MINKELQLAGLTGKMAGLAMGSQSGNPIVAIHGWLDNAASFEPLANELDRHHWICLDLPGHGKSEYRPPGSIYHFTDYVADVFCAIKSMQLEKFILVGHSLGAGIAATFAATFPDKVDRLVLIDGIGPISGEQDETLGQLKKSMAFLTKNRNNAPRIYSSWEGLVAKRLLAGQIEKSSAEILLRRGTRVEAEKITVLSDERLKQHSPIYMSQEKVISILNGITAPTQLIIAEQGLIGSRDSTRARIPAIKNLSVVRTPGGHHLHMDKAAEVGVIVESFLNQEVF